MKRINLFIGCLLMICVVVESSQKGKHTKKQHKSQYLFNKLAKAKKNTMTIDPFSTNKRNKKQKIIASGASSDKVPEPLFNAQFLNEYKRVVSQNFLFRKLTNGVERDDNILGDKMLTLNQYGLYVHNPKDKSLNGLEDMIRLDQMVSDDDISNIKNKLPQMNKIIHAVSLVEISSSSFEGQFPCFSVIDVDMKDSEWQICDYYSAFGGDEKVGERLNTFREALINKVVMHIEWKNQMRFSLSVSMDDEDKFGQKDGFDNWNYEKQDEWGGACKLDHQSPIDIIDDEVAATTNQIQCHPNYEGDESATAFQGTNDRYLLGDFGSLLYVNALESQKFFMCPWKIEFKYNAEHLLDSAAASNLEILVYHKKGHSPKTDGENDKCDAVIKGALNSFKEIETGQSEREATDEHTDMIVSFLVQSNVTLEADQSGTFWQSMGVTNLVSDDASLQKPYSQVPLFDAKQSKASQNKDMIANLEGLIDDGLKARFPYSFYFYKGSLSQPTCKSEVLRAVMYTKIDVAVDLFDSFKSKVMDGYKDKQNFRKPRNEGTNTMKGYQVMKHIDQSQKQRCPTSELMKSYTDKDYKRKLSPGEYLDYEKLIASMSAKEQEYSSAYKKLNQEAGNDSLKALTVKPTLVDFNHKVAISTKIHHVHKVPRKLINKIFKADDKGLVKDGSKVQLGKMDGNTFDVTYLGESMQAYNTKLATSNDLEKQKGLTAENKKDIKTANTVIDQNDKYELDKSEPQPQKVINQNNLPPLEKEQLAPYLVEQKDDEDKGKDLKSNKKGK